MRFEFVPALILLLAGCPQSGPDCTANVTAFADGDGDGYGAGDPIEVCAIGAGQADQALDCDDADPAINPDGKERCDGVDNNCDGSIDEDTKELKQYWADNDGDGFGGRYQSQMACASPGAGWARNAEDCDDADPKLNPNAQEVCGGGDEDCDGLTDDQDPSVDKTTWSTFYTDRDRDGKGDPAVPQRACELQFGLSNNADDCDDTDPLVGQYAFYEDRDKDGYGDPDTSVQACVPPLGYVTNKLDCDDHHGKVNLEKNWYVDNDGDGFGGPSVQYVGCEQPPDTTSDSSDCNDSDVDIHPGTLEVCDNGIDEDCDNDDRCDTCQKLLTQTPGLPDGLYTLDLDPFSRDVWCDMTTDGGGWTTVLSSNNAVQDQGELYSTDLQSLDPEPFYYHSGLWSELRTAMGPKSDIRFACSLSGVMKVDLSFYGATWYQEITTGYDKDSCFEAGTAASGHSYPVARRNNLTGDTRAAGDAWNTGYLEGEDRCAAYDDFDVDFDDGGVAGNPNDGTDWGMENYRELCGKYANNAVYFAFVR